VDEAGTFKNMDRNEVRRIVGGLLILAAQRMADTEYQELEFSQEDFELAKRRWDEAQAQSST